MNLDTPVGALHGTYSAAFQPVADAFAANFRDRRELGASVCVMVDGAPVVDLWGGSLDPDGEKPWQEDTISIIFSSTKGAVALAAHTLVSAGALDLEAPVTRYWPEFGDNGKSATTVRMMLDHSAGVPCLREQLPEGACRDWDGMTERIAREAPFWKPGTRNGYHMMTFGWTVGELIRRVAGQSLGAYFRAAVAEPAKADCWIGLPESEQGRVARMYPFRPAKGDPLGEFAQALIGDADSIQALALFNQGGFNPNDPSYHRAEIGGGGGISNGRGLARIYAPFACGGELAGHRYVTPEALARMSEVAVATNEDATLLLPTRFGLGFMKSMDNRRRDRIDRHSVVLGSPAFGHVGAGGSIGFADPRERLSFGYTMNRMGAGILMNERGQSLIDATYRCLGHTTDASGVWRRD